MASKFRPGIPDTFTLNVTPVQDLGDYLDEPPPTPRPKTRVAEKEVPAPQTVPKEAAPQAVVVTSVPQPVTPPVPASVESEPAIVPEPPRESVTVPTATAGPAGARNDEREERGGRPKAPRREISMTPETLRMSDELLDIIRCGSGQRDTKANELFHALVLLVHEVKDEIDTHAIPKRGRWGTPTARAYPLELKNAFLKALLKKAAERDTIELRYAVESAA